MVLRWRVYSLNTAANNVVIVLSFTLTPLSRLRFILCQRYDCDRIDKLNWSLTLTKSNSLDLLARFTAEKFFTGTVSVCMIESNKNKRNECCYVRYAVNRNEKYRKIGMTKP